MTGTVRRLLLGHAAAAVAMSLPWPLLLVLVWDRWGHTAHGDLLLGLTGAARMLPYVALSWATGALADRFRRDRLLRVTVVARVLLLGVVAGAVAQGRLPAAIVAASLAVACGTPAYPALAAAMPQVAGDGRRRATDLLVTIEVASFVVGPAVGGLLLAPATRPALPGVAVALTVVALLLLHGVVVPSPGTPRSAPGSRARSVLGTARRSAGVPRAIGTVALLNAVLAAAALALLPLVTDHWHGGDGGYGLATGVLGFGALAAPLLWRLGGSTSRRSRSGLLLIAAALALVPVCPALGWALPALAVAGAAAVHVEAAVTEAIQDAVPDTHRAGILGLADSVMVGAALLGSLLAPWLGSTLGAGRLLALLAGACVLAVVGPRRAQAPRPPEPRIPQQRDRATGRPGGKVSEPRRTAGRARGPARPHDRSWSAAAPRG